MNPGRRWLIVGGGLPFALSGCVAAAIPLAAGGLLAKGQLTEAEAPAPAAPAAQAAAAGDLKVTRLALAELPPPDTAGSAASSSVGLFRDYTLAQLAPQPGSSKRPSALLTRASELRSERAHCGAVPLAVFIDLDPGRGTFDPMTPGKPDAALPDVLRELREQGVTIVWFSRLGGSFEPAVRAALATSDLDRSSSDQVVLLRDLSERKQSRRDETAKLACPIAMVGDERADFDELYLYLKNPDAAVALDAMIGRGWFLASPFVASAAAPSIKTENNQ